MKRNSCSVWCAAWMGCLLLTVQAQEAVHAPRIVCDEPNYDFGERDSSEVVSHVFTIKNEGDLTLEIARVRPSCGCTVARISRQEVPPGETTEITTEFSLKGRSGRQHKNIRVENNDPANQNFMLYLEGNIITELTIEPPHLYLGQISPSQIASQSVMVTSTRELVITGVVSTVACLTPVLEEVEAGRKYRVGVTTQPPMDIGTQQGELRLQRDGGEDLVVPVSLVVVGALTYAPKELVLRADDPNVGTRYIIIRPGEVQAFEVTGVEMPDESLKASVTTLGANGYRIQIGNIQAKPELDGMKVIIRTTVEKMPVIEIPFKIIPSP